MKLSELRCSNEAIFGPIVFRDGLNVVMGRVRSSDSEGKDTHNLGKTTLMAVIDFCLLGKVDNQHFMKRHPGVFGDIFFALEVLCNSGTYLTIGRGPKEASKIWLAVRSRSERDLRDASSAGWGHSALSIDKARKIVDGILDLSASDWGYRKIVGYCLRKQGDYADVFQLGRDIGKHADWKPFLAEVLGFNGRLVESIYALRDEIEELGKKQALIEAELRHAQLDLGKLRNLISVKRSEVDLQASKISAFSFEEPMRFVTRELVEQVDDRLSELGQRRYYLVSAQSRIDKALQGIGSLDVEQTRVLFEEMGVVFGQAVVKSYEELVAFEQSLTRDRAKYLREERLQIAGEIADIEGELARLEQRRSELWKAFAASESVEKFKVLSQRNVDLRADLLRLEGLLGAAEQGEEVRKMARAKLREREDLVEAMRENVGSEPATFGGVRSGFARIVQDVLGRTGLLSIRLNSEGNVDFSADIMEGSLKTDQAAGHTYRRLLCIAFDVAVLWSRLDRSYSRFVAHDGFLEGLDDRKKVAIVDMMRASAGRGVQHLVTVIDSELPKGRPDLFREEEVVLTLHDLDEGGRLFRVKPW